ncbi:anticodon nuclease prrc [Treponema succinifaciens DSM 2489]|uniref:Anticodon nuclease prrc n=2 Tax=Treponema TaxID=157 RepID=F2NRC4_TRES6|nr:anticodon nuclease prrc [Treponema succinifaciens DSM 2489]
MNRVIIYFMGLSLTGIAEQLKNNNKKVQLIYAFNGVGKTRLSREFKELVNPKHSEEEDNSPIKFLYYNAFTEDLFVWDNDLDGDENRKIIIQPNNFTNLAFGFLKEQGQDGNIANHFKHYTHSSITPKINDDFSEVTFSILRGGDDSINNIKISKGEESNFVWCIFYSLIEQIVEVLNIADANDRSTNDFDHLEYIFIDDPVTSLDENHLIELAVDLAQLIKNSKSEVKFIITTHNPLFYNVLYNELDLKNGYMLELQDDNTYKLTEKKGDSNKCFSYHLFLIQTIKKAIDSNNVQKYHFILLRNLYEKTANFLGYPKWSELLPDDKKLYYNRIIQFTSHSTLSNEIVAEPTEPEKQTVKFLLNHLINNKYYKESSK